MLSSYRRPARWAHSVSRSSQTEEDQRGRGLLLMRMFAISAVWQDAGIDVRRCGEGVTSTYRLLSCNYSIN